MNAFQNKFLNMFINQNIGQAFDYKAALCLVKCIFISFEDLHKASF
jgi:hypothetical protein